MADPKVSFIRSFHCIPVHITKEGAEVGTEHCREHVVASVRQVDSGGPGPGLQVGETPGEHKVRDVGYVHPQLHPLTLQTPAHQQSVKKHGSNRDRVIVEVSHSCMGIKMHIAIVIYIVLMWLQTPPLNPTHCNAYLGDHDIRYIPHDIVHTAGPHQPGTDYRSYLTDRVSSTSSQPLGSMLITRWVCLRSLRPLWVTSLSSTCHDSPSVSEGSSAQTQEAIKQLVDIVVAVIHEYH